MVGTGAWASTGPPPEPSTTVERTAGRLLRDHGDQRRAVVVFSGSGWGAQDLVAAHTADRRVAWLRLGAEHTEAARLRDDLAAALAGTSPDASTTPGTVEELCRLTACEVLVLDGAHHLSAAGGEVVRALVAARPAGLRIIVLTREPDRSVAVGDGGSGAVLALDATHLAYDAAGVAALLEADLGATDPAVTTRIVERTAGWPVAVRVVIDALLDAPAGERLDRVAAVTAAGGPVGRYVRDTVLPSLDDRVRDDVACLTLLDGADAARFAAATDRPVADAQEALDGLVRRGLAGRVGGSTGREVAVIAVIGDAVWAHGWLDGPRAAPQVEAIAQALRRSGDVAGAADVLRRGGRHQALASLLTEEGWGLLYAGHLTVVRDATAVPELAGSLPVALLRAHACAYLGDRDGAQAALHAGELAARASSTAARTAARDGGAAPRDLAAQLALAHGVEAHLRGDPAAAIAAYARAEPADDALVAELAGWSSTAHWLRGEVDQARGHAQATMRLAGELADDRLLALAHTAAALVAASDGDRAENLRQYDLALSAARRAGDALQEARILTNRGSLHLEEGRFDAARVETEAAIDLTERQGSVQIGAIARCNRAEILLRTGSLDEAIADAQLARERFAAIGSRHESYAHHLLGDARRERGELVLARRAYERSLQLAGSSGDRQGDVPALIGLARTLITSDPDAAADAAQRAAALDHGIQRASVLLVQGWIALARGDHPTAAARVAEAEAEAVRRADRTALAEAATLGALLATDPRPGLQDAVAQWRELDARIAAARVELGLLRRSRRAADQPRAAELEAQLRAWGCATEHGAYAHVTVIGASGGPRTTVRLLGEFAVERDGYPVPSSAWGSRKARDLLKVLAMRGARGASREELADLLWPDEAYEVVSNRLSVALSVVRGVLSPQDAPNGESSPLATDGATVRIDTAHVAVDLERFEQLADAGLDVARAEGHAAAVAALDAAERAYGGDLLEHDHEVPGVAEHRERLRSTYVTVTRTLARSLVADDPDRSVRLLLRVLDRDPHDEPAHWAVCAALVRAGRHGEARRRYDLYVRRMAELGLPAVDREVAFTEP